MSYNHEISIKKTCKKYRLRRNVNSRHPYTSWTTKPHVVLPLHWLLVTAKGLWLLRSTYPGFTESALFPQKICLLPYFLLGLVLLTSDTPKFHIMKVFSIRLQRIRNRYGNAKVWERAKVRNVILGRRILGWVAKGLKLLVWYKVG